MRDFCDALVEVLGKPFRYVAFVMRRPDLAWYLLRTKRALRRGEWVVEA